MCIMFHCGSDVLKASFEKVLCCFTFGCLIIYFLCQKYGFLR